MKFRELARLAVILATAAVTASAFAAPVKVATEASFPPFSKTEADGSYAGFEIDLGNEVCKRAGLECEWVKQDFDGMIAGLLARKFDMIFSSMSIKPEREKVADFSIPYYTDKYVFYGKKGSIKDFDNDVKGKRLCRCHPGPVRSQILCRRDGACRLRECRPDPRRSGQWPHRPRLQRDSLAKDFMAKPEGQAFEVIRVIEDPEVLGKVSAPCSARAIRSRPRSMRRSAPSMPMAR